MKTKPDKEQIPINFSFISNKTFRNFITGENEIILETLKGLSKEKKTNIIFLRGDKSTGKTHLCLATLENFIGKKHYLSPSNVSELESFNFSSLEFIIIDDLDKIITDFNKEEKTHLFHIATCKLLSKYGYYRFKLVDEDGWPHWEELKSLGDLSAKEQKSLMKKAIVEYFESTE